MTDRLTEKYMKKLSNLVAEAGRGAEYEKYFMNKLAKTGFNSITDMPKNTRKGFFINVNKGWHSQEEKRKAMTPTKNVKPVEDVEETMRMLELTPPAFPQSLKERIVRFYEGDMKKAYPTMWNIHDREKNGKKVEELDNDFTYSSDEYMPQELDEVAPPGFPKKLYNKIKSQYPGEPDKAYATMWKIDKNLKELRELMEDDKIPDEFSKDDDEAELINKAPGQGAKDMYEDLIYTGNDPFDKNKVAQAAMSKLNEPRKLSVIASEIRKDWKNVNFAAKPYLSAMSQLDSINDMYGADPGSSIVAYFLSNATTWRGPVAKQIKLELNKMLKSARSSSKPSGGRPSMEEPALYRPGSIFEKELQPHDSKNNLKSDIKPCEKCGSRVKEKDSKLCSSCEEKQTKVDETSTTGGVGGYSTPFAFTGGKSGNEKKRKQSATAGTGYKIVGGKN